MGSRECERAQQKDNGHLKKPDPLVHYPEKDVRGFLSLFVLACVLVFTALFNPLFATAASSFSGPSAILPGKGPNASHVYDSGRIEQIRLVSRILAGIKSLTDGSQDSPLAESDSWLEYCLQFDREWKKWKGQKIPPIARWARHELAAGDAGNRVVFYPFSGPDFLYASILFPEANTYILTGLEPAGSIPSVDQLDNSMIGAVIETAMGQIRSILGLSFFRRNDLKKSENNLGIVSMLLIFISRMEYELLDVCHVYLDKRSWAVTIPPGQMEQIGPRQIRGVRILFRRPTDAEPKTLYYFCTDLSDSGLAKNPEYLGFVDLWPAPATFLKAASYLLHKPGFSKIRDFILEKSSLVLQDDSGIPINSFQPHRWNLRFFGGYQGPIPLFAEYYQESLSELIQSAKPLDFGIGYRFKPTESNLILAIGKAHQFRTPEMARLQQVTLNGIMARDVIFSGDMPEIILNFSTSIIPYTVQAYIRHSKGAPAIGLDMNWDADSKTARCMPISSAKIPGTFSVVICDGAKGVNGQNIRVPENWSFRILGLSDMDPGQKIIFVDRAFQQVLLYGEGRTIQRIYPCATGTYYPTAGSYYVINRYAAANSLFDNSRFSFFTVFQKSATGHNIGFHSIPIYPDGRAAGLLGFPISHGCVRMSREAAEFIYTWAPLGTKVIVY